MQPMQPTLVVVDMQPCFEASLDVDVIVGVTCEIVKARQRGAPIILVEYRGFDIQDRTHDAFYDLLRNYKRRAIIGKSDDDGSREILQTLKRRQFNSRHLRICGVNSDACVWSTVEGLLEKLDNARIDVVKRACGSEDPFDWRRFLRHRNLRLV